jgi:Na+-transporting methylmalonyl-CoA/oxaloacetate decarboxylase gamma subunit
MGNLNQLQGGGGAVVVSFIAFTIVFIVLVGLTAVICAIKFFSGNESKAKGDEKNGGTPANIVSPSVRTPVPANTASDKNRVTAAITAAILTVTQGRGRILNIAPAFLRTNAPVASNWRTSGIVERVGNQLVRAWKH